MHDVYEALVESASQISRNAIEGTRTLEALRAEVRAKGGTPIGAGIHPSGRVRRGAARRVGPLRA